MTTPLLPPLRPGDAISIVAPASSPTTEALEAAVATVEAAGYRPKTYRDVCASHGYLAGTDDERAADLNAAFADAETPVVLAARGGYGVGRILDRIDFTLLARRPKLVCGYSDITALHAAIQSRCGLPSLHGPNLIDGVGGGGDSADVEQRQWLDFVSGKVGPGDDLWPAASKPAATALAGGSACGTLTGGNLAVLVSLLGTPDEPDFHGAILLLEDTGEAPYRVDRLLTQLRLAGLLDEVAGVVCGYFSDCGPETPAEAVDRLLEEFLAPLGVPVASGFPSGHEHPNAPLPLGALVELDSDEKRLTLMQTVVGEPEGPPIA